MSMAESPVSFKGAAVVMGVASCGKTCVGELLAEKLGAHFIEGDRLHPAANVAKMSAGNPLNDEDRWPWLKAIGESLAGDEAIVASCSALKRVYREAIAKAAQRPVYFVYLHGSRELLEQRIGARKGHFMPASLLDSQLATLQMPEPDERALRLDIVLPVSELAERAKAWLLTQ
jgi:gluconokinase